jgi:hypothetical protein
MKCTSHNGQLSYDTGAMKNLKGRDTSEDLDVDEKIISEWILGKWGERLWAGCI